MSPPLFFISHFAFLIFFPTTGRRRGTHFLRSPAAHHLLSAMPGSATGQVPRRRDGSLNTHLHCSALCQRTARPPQPCGREDRQKLKVTCALSETIAIYIFTLRVWSVDTSQPSAILSAPWEIKFNAEILQYRESTCLRKWKASDP